MLPKYSRCAVDTTGVGSMETVSFLGEVNGQRCVLSFQWGDCRVDERVERRTEVKTVAKRDSEICLLFKMLGGWRVLNEVRVPLIGPMIVLDGPTLPKGDLGRSLGQRQTCN